jgi:hypothetical protein
MHQAKQRLDVVIIRNFSYHTLFTEPSNLFILGTTEEAVGTKAISGCRMNPHAVRPCALTVIVVVLCSQPGRLC